MFCSKITRYALLGFYSLWLPLVSHSDEAAASDIDVLSRVERVTVYQQSAEIARHASTEIPAGDSTIIFTGVPSSLNPDSVRVSGKGSTKVSISGVEYKTRFLKEEFSQQAKELDEKIKLSERELATLQSAKARLDTHKQLVAGVSLDSAIPSEKGQALRPRSPQEMAQVLTFISDASAKLDAELLALHAKIEDLTQTITVLKQQRSTIQSSGKQESVVSVKVDALTGGRVDLELTYQVHGARWRPTYNLNVSETKEGNTIQLETYGLVQQSTGEDWTEVELALSTAQAHVGLTRPVPSPRLLDIVAPVTHAADMARGGAQMPAAPAAANRLAAKSRSFLNMEAEQATVEEIQEETAELDKLGMFIFKVPRKATVASNRSQEKFKLGTSTVSGAIVNVVVPALQQHVYREALVKNSTGAPLLPGTINVFADGGFVGRQTIEFTQPEKEVRLSIGLSNSIAVTRKQTRRFEEDPGVIRSFRRISVGYEIRIENLSSTPQNIVVLEPGPISLNDKVKVDFTSVTPPSLDAKDVLRLEKEAGVLEWHLNVPSKGNQTAQYEARVEFEAGLNVAGLDTL